ncbi:hypothetical protein HPB52_008527 [Rhipicephalus sanguineus]|uniref:Peptidase M13 N-terminal domain-containing protein n=1 Tax=Rhipicephalus sanguineus TaxID=34632 RepID=A0A9D4QCV2_RHISA|nr:hypothetical protein HPB52_008527 [Rhipicephalus sanguineus]
MNGSAVMLEPRQESRTSPHQTTRLARAAAFCSSLTSKYPWHSFPILTCGLTLVVAFIVGAVYVTYLFEQRMQDTGATHFCCPNEVEQVFWYVNRSVIPCKDFFSYVCSNVISDASLVPEDRSLHSWRALITGHTAAGAGRTDIGRFVTAYYKSCMAIAAHKPSFMRSLASALVKVAWKEASVFKSKEAFTYMTTASVVYRLPSVVYISFDVLKQAMSVKVNLVCNMGTQDFDALAPVLDALSRTLNATTEEAVRRYALAFCSDLSAAGRTRKRYAMANESAVFDREVWNIDDVRAGLEGCGFSLRNVTSVDVQGVGEVRTFYSAFAANEDSEATAKTIAYLVWYSVFLGSGGFYRSFDGSAPSVFRVCMASLRFISEIQSAFSAAQFMSPEKDVEARKIFARVRNSVYADCQHYSLIDSEDSAACESFFKNMQIVSSADLAESLVPIPNATDTFGENLLRGRAYGFEVVKRRHSSYVSGKMSRYGYVDFSGDKWLQLSSIVYKYLSASSGEHNLRNYAFVGRLLAETLWYMVFTHANWSTRTLDKIGIFRRCFVSNHPSSNLPAAPIALTIATMGLASTLHALNVSDWYDPVVVGSMWRVSHAQFFYILTTYHKCPTKWDSRIAQTTNVSLQYLDDFANAFHCPKTDAFAKIRQCVLEVRRRR